MKYFAYLFSTILKKDDSYDMTNKVSESETISLLFLDVQDKELRKPNILYLQGRMKDVFNSNFIKVKSEETKMVKLYL